MLGLVKQISVGVCGDAKAAAAAILTRLETMNEAILSRGNKAARLAEVKKQKDAWEAELNQWGQAEGSPVGPRRALRELEKAMPKNAMVTTDIGNICSVSNSYLRFERRAASSPP
jgi:Thiamine pyrophosphate-requiring enzymes [acetolactate synthase, pyruvate dehydrogenase (cytochrome), glyoxylate carboligase, phosphonopyruvate decarboxylase]